MKAPIKGAMLGVAMLSTVAFAAAPAHATITPVNTAITGSDTASALRSSMGFTVRCPRADFSGRTSADGRSVSGTFTFGGRTCTESAFGTSVTVVTRGSITVRSTSSVAGVSASGDYALDTGGESTETNFIWGSSSVRGPQTVRGCVTIRQGPPSVLDITCLLNDDAGGTMVVSTRYTLNRAITIS